MAALSNQHMLIVDDDPALCLVARRVLENIGLKVSEAHTIAEAITTLDSDPPHGIILDVVLPDGNGISFLRYLMKTPKFQKIPILILSSTERPEVLSEESNLGLYNYLPKPFSSYLVLQKVRKMLRDSTMLEHRFESGAGPTLTVEVECSVSEISESGIRLHSPVRYAPGKQISIKSKFLNELGAGNLVLRTTTDSGKWAGEGEFMNEILMLGIQEKVAKEIRKLTKG